MALIFLPLHPQFSFQRERRRRHCLSVCCCYLRKCSALSNFGVNFLDFPCGESTRTLCKIFIRRSLTLLLLLPFPSLEKIRKFLFEKAEREGAIKLEPFQKKIFLCTQKLRKTPEKEEETESFVHFFVHHSTART